MTGWYDEVYDEIDREIGRNLVEAYREACAEVLDGLILGDRTGQPTGVLNQPARPDPLADVNRVAAKGARLVSEGRLRNA